MDKFIATYSKPIAVGATAALASHLITPGGTIYGVPSFIMYGAIGAASSTVTETIKEYIIPAEYDTEGSIAVNVFQPAISAGATVGFMVLADLIMGNKPPSASICFRGALVAACGQIIGTAVVDSVAVPLLEASSLNKVSMF